LLHDSDLADPMAANVHVVLPTGRRIEWQFRKDRHPIQLSGASDRFKTGLKHLCLNPYEVHHALPPANLEPRPRWPRKSRCAKPQASIAGHPGDEFTLKIDFVEGRKHLPIVTLQRAA